MIHVMYYKKQGNHAICYELPFSTVGWVVGREPEGFIEFCGSNPDGSQFIFEVSSLKYRIPRILLQNVIFDLETM